jgi:ABC-type uncharacterized transport system substrate-binding protein
MRFAGYGLATILAGLAAPVAAHPHVMVNAKAELVFDKGKLTAVRHIWQFDDTFTGYAVQGLDADKDGKLSDAELAPLAQVNVESLSQFGFFTYLTAGSGDVAFAKPTEYWLEFHNARLTLFYTLPLSTPVAASAKVTMQVFDPEYFVAFTYGEDPVTLDGAPAGCAASYRPPQTLDARTMAVLSTIPADQRGLPPALRTAATALANVITVACK